MNEVSAISGEESCDHSDLAFLYQISRALNESRNITDTLQPVLRMVAEYIGMNRVILTILNRNTNRIFIEVAYGLSDYEKSKGKYQVGEGIIGRVVETGRPVIIPKIHDDPRYLNKTGIRTRTEDNQDISFVCVPIKVEELIVGTLSISRVFYENISLDHDIRLLTIIGTMIAQSVRARQERLEEIEKLKLENQKLHDQLKDSHKPFQMIGTSGRMQEIYDLIAQVAPTNSTVLIRGESGVGKELIAAAIQEGSRRAKKPFIKVNCSALPESLIESELFGHEKGAFTGADNVRKGRFEMAAGGTIFLDEIGDLPAHIQVKLLRTLQEKEFERVGSSNTIKADVRVIAATNRPLEELIQKGAFREDLYYRLNVFPIFVAPLRERKTDIPPLVDHFIEKCNRLNHTGIKRITSSAIDMLMVYHWPGNVRELENCIERACILSRDGVIRSNNLPPTLQTAESSDTYKKGHLDYILERVEKQMIIDALMASRGNMAKAADLLGITERIMGLRLKKYDIDGRKYRKLGNASAGRGEND